MGKKEDILTVPPYSNRGVQNTEQSDLVASVDWLSLTFKHEDDWTVITDFFELENHHFQHMERGSLGYKKGVYFDNIKILYDGQENMGVHIELTGQGCRTFEQHSPISWYELFTRLLVEYEDKVNYTRLDIAVDDFKGYFKIPNLVKELKKGNVTSKFKIAKHIENIVIKTGEEKGHTLYFGRPTSSIQVRFYEKNIEQQMKGNLVPLDSEIWNRTEIQARDERAKALAYIIANDIFDLGKIVTGTLKNYIQFRKPKEGDTNKSRWPICKWWNDFLGDCEKLKLTLRPQEKSIEKKYAWIDNSVTKSLYMIIKAFPEDTDSVINDFLLEGSKRLTKSDENVINLFKNRQLDYAQYKDLLLNNKKANELEINSSAADN